MGQKQVKQKNFKLTTPVLFLVFNRLEPAKKVFEEIRKIKPKQLFIAADGPRTKEEKKKTDAVRKYILENVDWKCDVKTLFRDINLGCKIAVSGAIDWFFENIEQGIILEDDCLPDQSFFRFCEELLEKYKDDEEIVMITGFNFLKNNQIKDSYYFTRKGSIWGWATWKRAWKDYDVDVFNKINKKDFKRIYPNILNRIIMCKKMKDFKKSGETTWDYQWGLVNRLNNKKWIAPKNNLIQNIGFTGDYTHAKPNKIDSRYFSKKPEEIKFPLKNPKNKNLNYDSKFFWKDLRRIILKTLRFF